MTRHLSIGLALSLLLAFGCGDNATDDADAGTIQDAGTKPDAASTCATEICNGVCCPEGQTCDLWTQQCSTPCSPVCANAVCGQSNGCGGRCYGICENGLVCSTATMECVGSCVPDCAGKMCGDADGCDGRCKGCPGSQTCNTVTFLCETVCSPACSAAQCGADDGCGARCLGSCPSGQSCNPSTFACENNTCTPNCSGKACGADDGCGARCPGTCPSGQSCNPSTLVCENNTCTPNCSGKACGADDGCGSRCPGTCPSDQSCNPSTFVCEGSSCAVAANLGALPQATTGASHPLGAIVLSVPLNTGALPDYLQLELYEGMGPFIGGFVTGTFPLTGSELQYATCTLCVRLFGDTDSNGAPAQFYMATGGTVTLSSVSGYLTGSLSGVSFEHVTIDSSYNSTPVGDGCTSYVSSMSFDAYISQ
jgi:hypothetical protein